MTANRTIMRAVAEVTPGTTPTDDPGWFEFPYTTSTLDVQVTRGRDQSIIPDGMVRALPMTDVGYTGAISAQLIAGFFDPFIAAAMGQSDWTTNTLKNGVLVPTFSIEKEFDYLASGNKFVVYSGVAVAGIDITCNYGDNAAITFNLIAMGKTEAATSAVGIGTSAPVGTYDIITGASGFGPVLIGGSALPSDVISRGYTISIRRPLVEVRGLGTPIGPKAPAEHARYEVPVTLSLYHTVSSQGYAEAVATDTAFDLDVTLSDAASKSYQFDTPDIRLNEGADSNATGPDTKNMVDLGGEAQYESGLASVLQITRVP